MNTADIINLTHQKPYDGPDRRMDHDEWRAHVNSRLDDGAATMKELKGDIADNTLATKENKDAIAEVKTDTSEVVSLLKSFQGAFAVFNMIGKFARPLGYIAMAITSVWGLVTLAAQLLLTIKGGGDGGAK